MTKNCLPKRSFHPFVLLAQSRRDEEKRRLNAIYLLRVSVSLR